MFDPNEELATNMRSGSVAIPMNLTIGLQTALDFPPRLSNQRCDLNSRFPKEEGTEEAGGATRFMLVRGVRNACRGGAR
nr:hypothetical protein [Streptomyces chartreusis]